MLLCPTCQSRFEGDEQFCPHDGSPLGDESEQPKDRYLGRVLGGRYRLVERLGQGGMGTVYRALHTLMDKPVAIKILRGELATDGEAVARFHREAKSASRLDHDHCIRVTDFGQSDDGLLYLVMELLDGLSLGQVARRGPLPAARAASIGVAVAEALSHAHEHGIVHRDLKPDNVFLARRPRGREVVKVLDFGLAKLVHENTLGPSITQEGTVFGTPEYMAPEQAQGEKLDGRTDIYALGVILYQLVTGEVPFKSGNFVALLTKHVSEAPVPPRQRRPDLAIPEALEDVILRCMAKQRTQRYANAQEVAEALAPLAAEDTSQVVILPTPASARASASNDTGDSLRLSALNDTGSGPAAGDGDSLADGALLEGASMMVPRKSRGVVWAALVFVLACGAGAGAYVLLRPVPHPPPPVAEADSLDDLVAQYRRHLEAREADKALALAQRKRPTPDLLLRLAAVDEQRSRFDAMGKLVAAVKNWPKDARPHAHLARLLLAAGDTEQACDQARRAVSLDAGEQVAREVLTRCPAAAAGRSKPK